MLAATFLAIFLVPMFFKLVNDWHFRSKPEDFAGLNPPPRVADVYAGDKHD
jgi:hypothetical protein